MGNTGIVFELFAILMMIGGVVYGIDKVRQSSEKKADGIISALKEIQQELAKKD